MEITFFAVFIEGKLFIQNHQKQQIHNPTLYKMVQDDIIIEKNELGKYFYTKPNIAISNNYVKSYEIEGKIINIKLPPKVPEITTQLFTNDVKGVLIIYNDHFEEIHNPKLSEMIMKDLVKDVDRICLYTKHYTKINYFLQDDFIQTLPVKEYTFEGKIICVQLPQIKQKNSLSFDIFS